MSDDYFFEQEYHDRTFTSEELDEAEFELCSFTQCDFSQANLMNTRFEDCTFEGCDLSSAKFLNTTLQNTHFSECKILGAAFEGCNNFLLSMKFNRCQLQMSSFFAKDLTRSRFKDCTLHETDFSECNMEAIDIVGCDLAGTIFDHTNLENANLRDSFNFAIDPENNRIYGATFSRQELPGLLAKYGLHIK